MTVFIRASTDKFSDSNRVHILTVSLKNIVRNNFMFLNIASRFGSDFWKRSCYSCILNFREHVCECLCVWCIQADVCMRFWEISISTYINRWLYEITFACNLCGMNNRIRWKCTFVCLFINIFKNILWYCIIFSKVLLKIKKMSNFCFYNYHWAPSTLSNLTWAYACSWVAI